MHTYRVELSEHGHIHRVSIGHCVLAEGTGAVVCQAARVLQASGAQGRLEAWRRGTLCLSGPIAAFAARTVSVSTEGKPKFVRWQGHDKSDG